MSSAVRNTPGEESGNNIVREPARKKGTTFKRVKKPKRKRMSVLAKVCPICGEKFIIRHNRILLAECFLKVSLEMELFNHVQTHVQESRKVLNRIGGKCEA